MIGYHAFSTPAAKSQKGDFKLTVLNPKGADPEQDFPDFAGNVDTNIHAPVNFHAYAACVGGSFQRDVNKAIERKQPVLLLVRNDMKYGLKVLRRIKDAGIKIAVTFKGTGFHQFYGRFHSVRQVELLKEIVTFADGVLSPTQALVSFFQSLRQKDPQKVVFIPTPYPVDDARWDFSLPVEKRNGIMIGTRFIKTPSRNHLFALILIANLAERLNFPVGVIDSNVKQTTRILKKLTLKNKITFKNRMNYADYLRFMAQHRLVFQLDISLVPGQVAGDSCLCRSICLGGNSSIEHLIFPEFANPGQNLQNLLELTERLLTDDTFYRESIEKAQQRALEMISFGSVAKQLRDFYSSI